MKWEDAAVCEFCGCSDATTYRYSYTPPWYDSRPLELLKCSECNLVRASPRPDAEELYHGYLHGNAAAEAVRERKLARPNVDQKHRRTVEEACRHATRPVKRLYDMGCGAGTIMMQARELGLEAGGNDVNKAAVDALQELGFDAQLGFTKDIQVNGQYDVVMNLDYLEHSYTPFADLKMCHAMLGDGGVLSIQTLYLGSPEHRRDGDAWGLFGRGHFHYFFPETLRRMTEQAGFTIQEFKLGALVSVIATR